MPHRSPLGNRALSARQTLPGKARLHGQGRSRRLRPGGAQRRRAANRRDGELKLTFNLELLLQAVDRAGACDEVWLAAKMSVRGKGREGDARYRNLCRRLGFGMLAVTG